MTWERCELPPGVEAAARRLADAAERDGLVSCAVYVRHGEICGVSMFDGDEPLYACLIDGEWFGLGAVDG